MAEFYFMRHGETDWNREQRLQGQVDIPLNETGRQQAVEAGERFKRQGLSFDFVYASTLSRAIETAALATGRAQFEIRNDRRLIEMGFGDMEGGPLRGFDKSMYEFFFDPENTETPAGIEPVESLLHRTKLFLEAMKEEYEGSGARVLVVTHGVTLRGLLRQLMPEMGTKVWGMPVKNCVLYRSVLSEGHFSVPEIVDFA